MPSLLLVVFLLQLLIHLVNTVGAAVIGNLLWILYNKLPTPTSSNVRKQTELRREVVRLKREMNGTSSQDEFAKWAKLRRQHDKAVADYEQQTQSLQSFKTKFDSAVAILRWGGTNGLRFFLQFWYAKEPLFWLPAGWVPGYVEWILAFPRAPSGSISIQVWGMACASVIRIASEAIIAALALAMGSERGEKSNGEPVKMAGGDGSAEREKTTTDGGADKKEL